MRRAVAFIEANPDLNIGVADTAHTIYVEVCALQLACRGHLDITRRAYLRRSRLEHARTDLLDADARDTVTGIAARWGFASSIAFSAYYRTAYGERPRDTLRR